MHQMTADFGAHLNLTEWQQATLPTDSVTTTAHQRLADFIPSSFRTDIYRLNTPITAVAQFNLRSANYRRDPLRDELLPTEYRGADAFMLFAVNQDGNTTVILSNGLPTLQQLRLRNKLNMRPDMSVEGTSQFYTTNDRGTIEHLTSHGRRTLEHSLGTLVTHIYQAITDWEGQLVQSQVIGDEQALPKELTLLNELLD